MHRTLVLTVSAALLAIASPLSAAAGQAQPAVADNGIVKVRSAYAFADTVERLKRDISAKRIMLFLTIDQSRLASDAGIALRPSTLLLFGNPPLGTQFITSRAEAGLDWPVRLLVSETASGDVELNYTDFGWIARRYGITDRDAQLKMASEVISSITDSVAAEKRAASSR